MARGGTSRCKQLDGRWWMGLVKEKIPIVRLLPTYSSNDFISDLIAGVTVGLTVMPQGLAYATLAGLEPQVKSKHHHQNPELIDFFLFQYGLYSAFMGCFVYAIFGSCRDITIGPTALMALMTYHQVVGRSPDFAVLLCFLSGIVQLIMAVLHLGI